MAFPRTDFASWQWPGGLNSSANIVLAWVFCVLIAIAVCFRAPKPKTNRPPMLSDTIPFISNSYLYMTNMTEFLSRATNTFLSTDIFSFQLGPKKFYLVNKASNHQALFRNTPNISQDRFLLMVSKYVWGASDSDYTRLEGDKTGRAKVPSPGTENTPEHQRYWMKMHNIFSTYLARAHETNALAAIYQREFSKLLGGVPVGRWETVAIYALIKSTMFEAGTITLLGPRVLSTTPGFHKLFWDHDGKLANLLFGMPSWLDPKPCRLRDAFHAACESYLYPAAEEFDWDGPDAIADWEPVFGSRVNRELIQFLRREAFTRRTVSGTISSLFVVGTNSNSIPVVGWCLFEVIKQPLLLRRLREEVAAALVTDPGTGERSFDVQQLLSLPLLQSLYVESMRLHVSLWIMRDVVGPVTVDGFELEKGSVLQAATDIAHRDEEVWGTPEHPAAEFWPERHIKYVESVDKSGKVTTKPEFSMAANASHFFPYGGGIAICPGRFFAKQEILLTVAMLISRFDFEFVKWVQLDGKPSDRPAEDTAGSQGGGSMQPDRDMMARCKRLW